MKRVGMVLRLKPDAVESYKRYHAAVWPEVLQTLCDCNVQSYSIYLKGHQEGEWWAEMEEAFHMD